ncbi:MAG: hypothetical protein ABEK59_07985 [Halobacteria archaeon]
MKDIKKIRRGKEIPEKQAMKTNPEKTSNENQSRKMPGKQIHEVDAIFG